MNVFIKLTWLLVLLSPGSFAVSIQSLQSINDAVDSYVKSTLDANGQFQIAITPLDTRLQLALCDSELLVSAQAGEIKPGRNTISVKCTGSQNWMIYTSVAIKSFKNVLVLTKALRRKEVITVDALTTENRDVGNMPQGYLSNVDDVVNKQASRNLQAGTVLNRLSYEALTMVKRGDRVSIQLGKSGMVITTAGLAMKDGAKGDRIDVKNLTSQRMIQATVTDVGLVSVNF
jgi:flagella basal body P-ring formation protein FlgA